MFKRLDQNKNLPIETATGQCALIHPSKGHANSQTRTASKEPGGHSSKFYLSHTFANFIAEIETDKQGAF